MIANAGKGEGGWYQCTAYNTAGSCATRARISVEVPPDLPKAREILKLNIPYPPRIIEPEYEQTNLHKQCFVLFFKVSLGNDTF